MNYFQSYAVGKSRRNISELMDIRPDYANVDEDGNITQVDPDEVEDRHGDRSPAGRKSTDRWCCRTGKAVLKYECIDRRE